MIEPLYPVTIIRTRYGGAYEGNDWAAFNCDEDQVPLDATGCDSECEAFWRDPKGVRVGVGETPDQALAALVTAVESGQVVGAKEPPHLVIRTIRDWAGVRMDDRPIRRAVINRLGEPPAPMTEEEKERARQLQREHAAAFARLAISTAEIVQQVLMGVPRQAPADGPPWIEYGGTWTAFYTAGLAKAGTQVDVVGFKDRPNSRILLIGDINPSGGLCDDCTDIVEDWPNATTPPTVVTRYRRLVDESAHIVHWDASAAMLPPSSAAHIERTAFLRLHPPGWRLNTNEAIDADRLKIMVTYLAEGTGVVIRVGVPRPGGWVAAYYPTESSCSP